MLGFSRGVELSNVQGILTGDGTIVRHIVVSAIDEIEPATIQDVIIEAMMVNEIRQ